MTDQISGLQGIQSGFFRQITGVCLDEAVTHYGGRLAAAYVWGSVHRGEQVVGVSDLDLTLFVEGVVEPADHDWRRQANSRLERQVEGFGWGWLPVPMPLTQAPRAITERDSEHTRRRIRAGTYHLKYDATLVFDRDLTTALFVVPPGREWAREALESPLMLSRYAAGKAKNATDFTLPEEPALRFRKLARLAVLGGAYRLLTQRAVCSLKGSEALPLLKRGEPQWEAFLAETADHYILPRSATAAEVSAYAACLPDWLEQQLRQLDPADAKDHMF